MTERPGVGLAISEGFGEEPGINVRLNGDARLGPDGKPLEQAFLKVVSAKEYDPASDVGVTDTMPVNPVDALTESLKKPMRLQVQLTCSDGRREVLDLSPDEATAWLRETNVAEKHAFANAKIRERRLKVAIDAAQRLTERNQPPTKEYLTPTEEAYLREFKLIERVRVPKPEGGYSMRTQLREDFGLSGFLGGSGGSAYGGFVVGGGLPEYLPIGGPALQNQTITDVWFALSRAWWHWVHNPIAKRGCNLVRNFVLGRGVQIKCRDKKTQAFVDDWVDNEKMQRRLRSIVPSLVRDGEVFLRKIKPGDGSLHVRELPPMTIWDVVCGAEDIEEVFYYIQRWQSIVHPYGGPPASDVRWIERNIPATEVIHVKINAAPGELRGRGEMHALLVHLKRLSDYENALVLKEKAAAAYQWHYAVTGGAADVARIQAAVQQNADPIPGSSFVTNDVVKVEAVASAIRANQTGSGSTYEAILNDIAIGFGFSLDYFGSSGHSTRASSLVKNEPSTKTIEDWQELVGGDIIIPLVREAIAEGKRCGDRRLIEAEDHDFAVLFPAVARADSQTRVTLICRGESMNYISKRTAAQLYAAEMDFDDYDFDFEQETIGDESDDTATASISHDFEQVKKGLPEPTDVAFGPGEVPDPAFAGAAPAPPSGVDTDPANPVSAAGAKKIARDMATGDRRSSRGMTEARRRQQVDAATRILERAGAIVVLPGS